MAANFKIGQKVKLASVPPEGPVLQLSVTPEGDIQYLIGYKGTDNCTHERWFKEDELVLAE
jgi:hypothetical protein